MKQLLFIAGLIGLGLTSCSDKYKIYASRYNFKNESGKPEYGDLNYWSAHPWKKDPADSVPQPLSGEVRDSLVDVFFLHPTTFTKKRKPKTYNSDINDSYINAKTDYSTMLYQASAFNQHARVFAPRYRQAHLKVFLMKDKKIAATALETAYQDVKNAFEYYLAHWNKQRPIIIASHSQGSYMAERLLKDYFENKPLREKLVVAYITGWPVPKDYFTGLSMCTDSLTTGCICSWRTLKKGFVPWYYKKENNSSYATNPLTWTTTGEYVPREKNKGSVLGKFNKIYPNTTDARIYNGFLWVKKPKFPWSFLYLTRNYHIGDINLYYMNIRENVEQRIRAYFEKKLNASLKH